MRLVMLSTWRTCSLRHGSEAKSGAPCALQKYGSNYTRCQGWWIWLFDERERRCRFIEERKRTLLEHGIHVVDLAGEPGMEIIPLHHLTAQRCFGAPISRSQGQRSIQSLRCLRNVGRGCRNGGFC